MPWDWFGMILSQSGQPVKLDNCNQWNVGKGLQTRTVIWQSSEWCHSHIHHQSMRSDKICHAWSWWPFWHIMSKVFVRVIPFLKGQTANALYYKSFMQYQLHSAVGKKCPEQAVIAIIQSENAIAHSALWRMFSGGKVCARSLLSIPQAISMIWLSKVKQLLCGKWFGKREATLTFKNRASYI